MSELRRQTGLGYPMCLITPDCVTGHANSESNVCRPVSCWEMGAQADLELRLQIFSEASRACCKWGGGGGGGRKGGASPVTVTLHRFLGNLQ